MILKKRNLLLIYSFLFVLNVFSQEQVLLNNNETGQGLLRAKKGKCYIITPKHVIQDIFGSIKVIGHYGLNGTATVERVYETADLAILKLIDGDIRCEEWLKMSNFDVMLSTQSMGHLSIRDEDGSIAPMPVKIVSSGHEYILIKPIDDNTCINPGMSGSTFLVNGASAGILIDVDTDTCEGTIMRKDVIMRLTEPFFEVKQTQADVSRADLDKIADKVVSKCLSCKYIYCNFSKTRFGEYKKYIDKVFIGDSIDNLNTIIDVKSLQEKGLEEYGYIPILPGLDKVFVKIQFLDGTFSEVKVKEMEVKETDWFSEWTAKELKLIESTNNFKPNPVYAVFKPKINKLIIQIGSPLNTKNVLYSFDEGSFFEAFKPYDYSGSYTIFEIDFKISSTFIKLAYRLENGDKIGNFKYKIDNIENIIRETYKKTLINELKDTFSCYKIPPYQEYTRDNKNDRVRISMNNNSTEKLNRLGYSILKENVSKTVCMDLKNSKDGTRSDIDMNLLSVKEVRFGSNLNKLDKIIPIKLDVSRIIENKRYKSYSHNLNEVLLASFPSEIKEVYAQIIFFDNTKSRKIRIPINDEFKR